MIGKEKVSSRPVPISETLEVLEERKKAGELGYEQQLSYDHAKKFATIGKKEAKKLQDELEKFRISEKKIIKIIDIMPVNEVQLKNVLIGENVEEDKIKEILAIVSKYRGK